MSTCVGIITEQGSLKVDGASIVGGYVGVEKALVIVTEKIN